MQTTIAKPIPSTVKERPILFSGPMVRALLNGNKTQTRRTFSDRTLKLIRAAIEIGEVSDFLSEGKLGDHDLSYISGFCPYGHRGDRLWVKETWAAHEHYNTRKPLEIPEGVTIECRESPAGVKTEGDGHRPIKEGERGRWRPSIFMRRWMSRLTLEIVSVRVERLNECSEADAIAEGIDIFEDGAGFTVTPGGTWYRNPEDTYRALWESINGPGSWAQNPWVWVIEFKRL